MEPKFKVGDLVRVVESGNGIGSEDLDKIVEIIKVGPNYSNYKGIEHGYVIHPPLGNCKTGNYDGVVGETSFELIKLCYEIY